MELRVPIQNKGGKAATSLPCCISIAPFSNLVKVPKWAIRYLLEHEETERDRFKIGVFTEPKKGELYLEPGFSHGRENLRSNELLQLVRDHWQEWANFSSARIKELLVDPSYQRSRGTLYFRFYLDTERVRLVIRYTERPSDKFKTSLTLAGRRKLFL